MSSARCKRTSDSRPALRSARWGRARDGTARGAAVTPDQYVAWIDRYFSSSRPRQVVGARLRGPKAQAGDDVVQSCYLRLRTTATNKSNQGQDFWMETDPEAERYTLRALNNELNRHLRGLIDDDAKRSTGDAVLRDLVDHGSPPMPDRTNPQEILDAVAVTVEEAVADADRGQCPRCGRPKLLEILMGIVESARDELDPDQPDPADDAFEQVRRIDVVARSTYRAIGRVRGIDAVLGPDGVNEAAAQLVRRCRPCVEDILDLVVGWVIGSPEDFRSGDGEES